MNTQELKSLLARTAIVLLDEEENKKARFGMGSFVHYDDNTCGYSCCLLGHAAILKDKVALEEGNIYKTIRSIETRTGELASLIPGFVWSGGWPDDREQAAVRVLMWFNNDPLLYEHKNYNTKFPVPADLRNRLAEYL